MSKNKQPDFFEELAQELRDLGKDAGIFLRKSTLNARNGLRQLRGQSFDYVVLEISGALPQRNSPPRSFWQRQLPLPPDPLTFQTLNGRISRLAEATNVKGVVVILGGLGGGLATLQCLRQSLARLKNAGKELIIYTEYLDLPHYYVASVADKIVTPPSTDFAVLGLRASLTYLKDSLAKVGVAVDIINVSPYKSALDQFGRDDMSPEVHAQLSWLLADQYDQITATMAAGRGISQDEMKALIDSAPIYDGLVEKGLVDVVAYEDEMPAFLGTADKPATLTLWKEVKNQLLEKYVPVAKKFVGVVSLEGGINMGESRKPPIDLPIPFIGGESAGATTLIQALRKAETMLDNMAALVFHVDSPGGDALASDLIMREVKRIAEKIPVLVYMGDVAASGGYYVAAPAQHIMTQPGTVTGSIGVIMGRFNTTGLLEKVEAKEVSLQQGANAGLYTRNAPLNSTERLLLNDGLQENYRQFKQVVAEGRDLPFAELDPICNGRVWMGRQAIEHKLVDSHGDFVDAIKLAAEMGKMPASSHRIPTLDIYPDEKHTLLPQPYEAAEEITRLLSGERLKAFFQGKALMLLPFEIDFW